MLGGRRAALASLASLATLATLAAGQPGQQQQQQQQQQRCPAVKAARQLELRELLGAWFVLQYYASSQEAPAYRCMRAELSAGAVGAAGAQLSMDLSYSFAADPLNEQLRGNISWQVPEAARPAHWLHAERPYEGVYHTYVLDADCAAWALLLHCAEAAGSPRYLSSLVLARAPRLPDHVVAYLRDKLPRYGVELEYMFPMEQVGCESLEPRAAGPSVVGPPGSPGRRRRRRRRRRPLDAR